MAAVDPQQLRSWVYEFLRTVLERKPNDQNTQLTDIESYVKPKFQQVGALPQDTPVGSSHLQQTTTDAIREIIWSLIIQGIVVPGISGGGTYGENLPWFRVTDWGKRCLQDGEYLPYDTGQYISRLRTQIPKVYPTVILYLTEGLNCFRSGTYTNDSKQQ